MISCPLPAPASPALCVCRISHAVLGVSIGQGQAPEGWNTSRHPHPRGVKEESWQQSAPLRSPGPFQYQSATCNSVFHLQAASTDNQRPQLGITRRKLSATPQPWPCVELSSRFLRATVEDWQTGLTPRGRARGHWIRAAWPFLWDSPGSPTVRARGQYEHSCFLGSH